jgi:hypothetical protein
MSTSLRAARTSDEGCSDEAEARRVAIAGPELERAQRAYRGAIEAARAWRVFSPNPKYHDTTFWTLFSTLFAEPGMNRTTLIDRIMEGAGVSRSTAERAIREARESGLVCYRHVGAEVLLDLSDAMFNHCVGYFREWMDRDKLNKNLGFDDDYRG